MYGVLGSKFGREFRLAVSSPAEAIRALCTLLPDFERFLATSRARGLQYAVFNGKRNLSAKELTFQGACETIRIAPVLMGSKRAGAFQTIVGIVLIVVGAVISVYGYESVGEVFIRAGFAMTMGGVVQMLSPQAGGLNARESEENAPSYAFGGPVNTIAQGHPVGLLYGRRRIGGAIISAGIHAEEQM
nr:tail assembly protein [Pseudomonas sp. RIT-PI-AD]